MIKCLECGKEFIRPASHVWQVHHLTAREYKQKHGLDVKRGIATEEYKERMREHVLTNGTLQNLTKGAPYRFTGPQDVPRYKRSKQTLDRLSTHFERVASRKGAPKIEKITIQCAHCGKDKLIYPRYYKENNNYCGVTCRNIKNNQKKQ